MSDPVTVVTVATAVVCALVGGAFFAFSNWVMDALARRPNREGIAAMQVINVTVINPTFMAALFGVVLPCVGLAVWAVASLGNGAGAGWVLAGALLYTVGCAGLTMVANVPLNNELARQDPDDPRAVEVWQRFLSRWTTWNTARTVGSSRRSGAPDHRGDRRPMTHPQRPRAAAQRTRRSESRSSP